MPVQQVTDQHMQQWEERGYFILRNVIDRDQAVECRGVIKNTILMPDRELRGDERDPMDPMGDSPAARAARVRKLGNFCVQSPLIWHTIHAGESVARVAQHFLGDDLLLKFNSCFLKPAKTGSATPWHQDNGLWRDGETQPFNFWMALDPATKENGCMQFVPGSHREPIHTHVLYPETAGHGEIPKEIVERAESEYGLEHIEMEPGDAVFWHSTLFHYSPPNPSERSRIAVAGVYSTPGVADRTRYFRDLHWVMRGGEVLESFRPEAYLVEGGKRVPPPAFPRWDEVGKAA